MIPTETDRLRQLLYALPTSVVEPRKAKLRALQAMREHGGKRPVKNGAIQVCPSDDRVSILVRSGRVGVVDLDDEFPDCYEEAYVYDFCPVRGVITDVKKARWGDTLRKEWETSLPGIERRELREARQLYEGSGMWVHDAPLEDVNTEFLGWLKGRLGIRTAAGDPAWLQNWAVHHEPEKRNQRFLFDAWDEANIRAKGKNWLALRIFRSLVEQEGIEIPEGIHSKLSPKPKKVGEPLPVPKYIRVLPAKRKRLYKRIWDDITKDMERREYDEAALAFARELKRQDIPFPKSEVPDVAPRKLKRDEVEKGKQVMMLDVEPDIYNGKIGVIQSVERRRVKVKLGKPLNAIFEVSMGNLYEPPRKVIPIRERTRGRKRKRVADTMLRIPDDSIRKRINEIAYRMMCDILESRETCFLL